MLSNVCFFRSLKDLLLVTSPTELYKGKISLSVVLKININEHSRNCMTYTYSLGIKQTKYNIRSACAPGNRSGAGNINIIIMMNL